MNTHTSLLRCTVCFIAALCFLFAPSSLNAHCDTMNGPVVKAAQKALETGNVNLVLVWIQKKDEAEIKKAFERTLAVRKLSPLAKEMADMYFFETLVRIHRAGEGEPYTGLKSADTEVEPGIEMADQAIDKGSAGELMKQLNGTVEKNLRTLFEAVRGKKGYKQDDVDAGREYVAAYVTFIHYVEQLYQSAQKPSAEHAHQEHEASVH
jgi:hypothetical protein